MSDPITGTGAILAGKKLALLSLPFLGLGMVAEKAGMASIDLIKVWGPFLAAITAAIYMGGLFEQVKDFQVHADRDHSRLEQKINSEILHLKNVNAEKWNFREYKIDKAFNAINEGGRWTLQNATEANELIRSSISENSREDNVRHETILKALIVMGNRMTRTFERMDKIEGVIK